jgi:hypothetical protein
MVLNVVRGKRASEEFQADFIRRIEGLPGVTKAAHLGGS